MRRSVAMRPAVVRPSGTSQRASFASRRSGELQIARWSCRIFLKNCPSDAAVGDAVGDGDGCGDEAGAGVDDCADAQQVKAKKTARRSAARLTLARVVARFEFIIPLLLFVSAACNYW